MEVFTRLTVEDDAGRAREDLAGQWVRDRRASQRVVDNFSLRPGQHVEREQTEYVHHHETWFQLDPQADVVRLTKLYNWYGDDSQQVAGSVLIFAARYSPELKASLTDGAKPRIEWLPYDWKLNSVGNKQPR